MASEQAKSPAEQQPPAQPAQVVAYPHPYGAAHYAPMPPGAYGPPFYTFAPMPPDPNHDPNAPNGAPQPGPYLMAFPPPPHGLMYAYAPPPLLWISAMVYPPYGAPPMPQPRPKRKQVKMACTNCAAACKRCDDSRPCERCQKYGIADSCIDGQRKERKKGIKRGPYKRKAKNSSESSSTYAGGPPPASASGEGEGSVPPTSYPMAPESYYPFYYPHPHPAFTPHQHEGQANGEAAANSTAHPLPQPFFPLHPAVYPPYTQYAPGAVSYPPPLGSAPATAAPADVNGKAAENAAETNGESASGRSKKQSRMSKSNDDGKKKKGKDTRAETNGAIGHGEAQAGQPESPVESSYAHGTGHGTISNGAEHRHVVSPV